MKSNTCDTCKGVLTVSERQRCNDCAHVWGLPFSGALWDKREALEVIQDSILEERTKNKYTRHVKGVDIDVYDVLRAWDVTCPAIQHAVKKLLAPGQRGHKDRITDLREALASVQRGIEMEEGQ